MNKVLNLIKKHPRWSPFALEGDQSETIVIDGITYTIRLDNRDGVVIYAGFQEEIQMRSYDGEFEVEDVRTLTTQQIVMPTYTVNRYTIPFLAFNKIPIMYIPINPQNQVHMYDITWLWNIYMESLMFYPTEEDDKGYGSRFFNVWASIDGEAKRYASNNVSLANNQVEFSTIIPPGFKTYEFYIRGASYPESHFLFRIDMNILKRTNKNGKCAVNMDGLLVLYDETTSTLSVREQQLAPIRLYILRCMEKYIFAGETKVVTITHADGTQRIAPLQFCTRVAAAMDRFAKLITNKNVMYARFDENRGFQFEHSTTITLPNVQEEQQIRKANMQRLKILQEVTPTKRTTAHWEEMAILIERVKHQANDGLLGNSVY